MKSHTHRRLGVFFIVLFCIFFASSSIGQSAASLNASLSGDAASASTGPASPLITVNEGFTRTNPGDWLGLPWGTFSSGVDSAVNSEKNLVLTGGVWLVASWGNDSNDCTQALSPCATLYGVFSKPGFVPGDEVRFAQEKITGADPDPTVWEITQDVFLSGGWNVDFTLQEGFTTIDPEYAARRGIRILNHTVEIERFIISHCHSTTGGGIEVIQSSLTLRNSAVVKNSADSGGGIYLDRSYLKLVNVTVGDNSVSRSGAGIFVYGGYANSTIDLYNTTISQNRDVGLFNTLDGVVNIRNSIIAGNNGWDCAGGYLTSAGYNLIGDEEDCFNTLEEGDLVGQGDPFGPLELEQGVYPLLPGTPAIDGGNPAGCLDDTGNAIQFDQRGLGRYQGCDSGAYELQPLGYSTKASAPGEIYLGEQADFIITLQNPSQTEIAGVQVRDEIPIPEQVQYVQGSLTATSGSASYQDGAIVWNGDVPANGSVVISFTVDGGWLQTTATNTAVIDDGRETLYRTADLHIKPFHIAGKVTDSDGEPMPGVEVRINDGYHIKTDSQGNYRFDGLSAGEYKITAIDPCYDITPEFLMVTLPPTTDEANFVADLHCIYIPMVSSIIPVGIYGFVNYEGNPFAGLTLHLRFYDGSAWSTFATTKTDAKGYYKFLNVPNLQAGQVYYVRFYNDAANPQYLNGWSTRGLTSYTAGSTVNIGNFDIDNIELVAPEPGKTDSLPTVFKWLLRPATPDDSYDFNLYDYNDGDPFFYTDPPLGYVNSYTLTKLPDGFRKGNYYAWYIGVFSPDGGYGESYFAYEIKFK